ncbi:MAG: glycosyltransferase family 39 protein [Cyanobacteria bacterium SZAS-4]|nr:glycosyltransferase family 39 protein [Cyanobacteria bacterium SZAS-4]
MSVSQLIDQGVNAGSKNVSENSSWNHLGKIVLPAVVIAFAALVPIWFSFEHRIPTIDESGHILNAFTYADLFRHPRLLRAEWWHQFLSVNSFYPPFAHMTNGLFKAIFGASRAVDIAVLTLFNAALSLSVYGITMRLTRSSLAAVLSAVVINLYPELALLNRAFWLDFPLTAMVGVGLFSLFNFRTNPTWSRAILAGVALGAACMTKQIAVVYLVLPAAAVFFEKIAGRTKFIADAVKLAVAGLIAAAISAPWFVLNAGKAKLMADECAVTITHAQSFTGNLQHYAQVLPATMSPYLLVAFVLALVFARKIVTHQLYLLLLSAGGGVTAVCTLAWILPKPQYIAPALIMTAVVTGCFLAQMVESKQRFVQRLGWIGLVAAILQILSLEFSPYPVSTPQWFANIGRSMGNTISEPRLGITLVNARPEVDWGQYWAMQEIDKLDKGRKVYLNILANSPDLNVHTFELIAHDLHSEVVPTTSRKYTIGGDKATFSPAEALYYHWYLVQSENHYQGFADAASEKAFEQLKQFVKTDSHFEQVASHSLPDGSTLTLYRQK